jgi:hypothetical protein
MYVTSELERIWKKRSQSRRYPSVYLERHAITQAVSCRLPTVAVRVRSQLRSCRVCGERSGTGAGFLGVLGFPLPSTAPHSSSIIRGWYSRPNSGRRKKWTYTYKDLPRETEESHEKAQNSPCPESKSRAPCYMSACLVVMFGRGYSGLYRSTMPPPPLPGLIVQETEPQTQTDRSSTAFA